MMRGCGEGTGRRCRDYGEYRITVDPFGRTFTIKPHYVEHGHATPSFGLGNATIQLNLNHLPEKAVRKITGESTASGLIPPDGKKLSSWEAYVTGVDNVSETLTVKNGSSTIHYPRASETESYAVNKDEAIEENGIGFYEIMPGSRIGW
jgi:hypothetical protein